VHGHEYVCGPKGWIEIGSGVAGGLVGVAIGALHIIGGSVEIAAGAAEDGIGAVVTGPLGAKTIGTGIAIITASAIGTGAVAHHAWEKYCG
jgi:hypothetical protein